VAVRISVRIISHWTGCSSSLFGIEFSSETTLSYLCPEDVWAMEVMAPLLPNLDSKWRQMLSLTRGSLYSRERETLVPIEQVDDWVPRSGTDKSYPSAATRTCIPLTPCEEKVHEENLNKGRN